MRLRAFLYTLVVLAVVGAGALGLSRGATAYFEGDARARLTDGLAAAGEDWARLEVDGLRVIISGEAPDETSRFRAIETARQIVDPDRIEDATSVAAADPLMPPPFALELLRNESEISLIGLVPEGAGRTEITQALAREALGGAVTDMLETAAAPAPDGWNDSLAFGLDILTTLPRAKISVAPGAVTVTATAETDAARAALETRLRALSPEGIDLALDLSAPRPVIAPFRVAFDLTDGVATLSDCAAETEEDATRILAAARAAGYSGSAACPVGLGAPSPDWARGVVAGLDTVLALGGGRFAVSDVEAVLTGPPDVDAEALAAAGEALRATLPAVISLKTLAPPRMVETGDGQIVYAPRFDAALGSDGKVVLTGALQSETSRAAVASYAAALFGHDRVTSETVVDPALPEGWPGRVLTGIEALSRLKEGGLSITLEEVALDGSSLEKDADALLEALFAEKVGTPARVDVSYDAEASAIAARTLPEICADEIAGIMQSETIEFDAGSATIAPESRGVIAAVADVLRTCPGAYFEVGGHTDSQGRAEVNQRLSEERAGAVMAALEGEALPLILLSARGYGAERPVADNATAEGRSRNRRIELTLVRPGDIDAVETEAEDAATAGGADPETCAVDLAAILEAAPIQFDLGSSAIAAESAGTVEEMAEALTACPGAAFEIGGHTDDRGPAEVNDRLSRERAEAVLAALGDAGVAEVTLTAAGYGSARPVADNGSAEGRERNRRIEMALIAAAPGEDAVEAGTDGASDAEPETTGCATTVAAILEADGIQFDPGSSAIAAESAGTIAALTEALGACGGATFEIGGHTDDRGSSEGNLRLSRARAEAVLAALEAAGPEGMTLTARGYGEDAPIADNGTSEGRSANRRIEIRMLSGPETPDAAPAPGPSEDATADDAAADTDQEAAGDEP